MLRCGATTSVGATIGDAAATRRTVLRNGTRGGNRQLSRKTKPHIKVLFVQRYGEWGQRPSSFIGGRLGMKLLSSSNVLHTTKTHGNKTVGGLGDTTDEDVLPGPYLQHTYTQKYPQHQS